jgi:lysophospholipase L1-like esterase
VRPIVTPVRAALVAVAALVAAAAATAARQNPDPARFEKDIAAFEAEDAASPPPAGATLFVGSSSIRYWDVARDFPSMRTIRRGFGGSHVSDAIHFAPRIIVAYKPALIVFYAGDADVAAKKSAAQIAADTHTLVALVHARLPGTRVVVIGTKPSPAHWAHMPTIREANALVRAALADDPLGAYADVEAALLGPDGRPRADLYAENGLNLNDRGYAAWTTAVRPVIEQRRR